MNRPLRLVLRYRLSRPVIASGIWLASLVFLALRTAVADTATVEVAGSGWSTAVGLDRGTFCPDVNVIVVTNVDSMFTRTCQPGIKPPLVEAVEKGDLGRARSLLGGGADPNEGQPPSGPLPLDIARTRGDNDMVELLTQHGAKSMEAFNAEFMELIERKDMAKRVSADGSPSNPKESPLEGEWKASDPYSDGLTRIAMLRANGRWTIQAWGKCTPTDCDWGAIGLVLLENREKGKVQQYGFAAWDHGFKQCYMTLRVEEDKLVAESFSIFTDDSGRSNYRSVEVLQRTEPTKPATPAQKDATVSQAAESNCGK